MSGHSKWANIQHRKSAQDKKRGKVFTKIIREITVAARKGGDVNSNPRLRLAVDKALSQNMTKDTIDRAIKRGVGGVEGANFEDIVYEGYGPGGIAVLVECMTDNRNRTVSEVRYAFTKMGGGLGTTGSVSYLFSKKGQIIFPPGSDEDAIMEKAVDAGAEDVVVNDDQSIEILTLPEAFDTVKQAMLDANLDPVYAEVTMLPSSRVVLDKEAAEKALHLTDMLEDLDDVQSVYSNASISAEVFKDLE
jgi:YebC/PmpR family DNA-binding regulatory protein